MSHSAANTEKRQFSRIAFDSPVSFHNDDASWESRLIDISLKGALIQRPDNWHETTDAIYKLAIILGKDEFEIEMDVKLAHCDDERVGFYCEQIDIDSISKLRRLVELNLGNEELLEREISNMLVQ